jgi:hypothetical protein
VPGGARVCFGCVIVSETAQVELRSGRVSDPAAGVHHDQHGACAAQVPEERAAQAAALVVVAEVEIETKA